MLRSTSGDGVEIEKSGGRRRDHSAPSAFPAPAWRQLLIRVWGRIFSDHLSIVSAGVAFFSFLAIFPALAALIGLYGFVADPADVASNLQEIRPILPPDAYSLISGQVTTLAGADSTIGVASLIALFFALWSARLGVTALIEGLNIVYRETDTRGILSQYLMSLIVTFLVLIIGVAAILAIVALPAALQILGVAERPGAWLARVVPVVILGCAIVFVIGGLYRYGPHRRPARKRWVSYGAVLAAALWVVASLLLSLYVSRFADFNETYGSLGAIAALLFWLYVSAFVILLGGVLNAEMELQTTFDTTVGAPKPMGSRGAYVADNVVESAVEDEDSSNFSSTTRGR
jgi:membrane protein